MSKKKRIYTADYKRNAVKLSAKKGNVAKVARELGYRLAIDPSLEKRTGRV